MNEKIAELAELLGSTAALAAENLGLDPIAAGVAVHDTFTLHCNIEFEKRATKPDAGDVPASSNETEEVGDDIPF